MPRRRADSILRRMIRANDDYWDFDRATYEDELGAWRERTAVAVADDVATPASRLPRPRIWPNLRPEIVSGDRPRLAARRSVRRATTERRSRSGSAARSR